MKKTVAFLDGTGELKRPLTTDVELKKEFDAVDVILNTRYSPVVLNGFTICKITGLNTS